MAPVGWGWQLLIGTASGVAILWVVPLVALWQSRSTLGSPAGLAAAKRAASL
jgi:hypothetical protein